MVHRIDRIRIKRARHVIAGLGAQVPPLLDPPVTLATLSICFQSPKVAKDMVFLEILTYSKIIYEVQIDRSYNKTDAQINTIFPCICTYYVKSILLKQHHKSTIVHCWY